jgi:N-acetylglucosamine-6-phosphate deacetylase
MQCDLLLYGGKVVAETGTLPRGYVAVDGGRIISIGENWQGIEAKKYLDVSSYLVVPGFIDMHTHGICDVDFVEGDFEKIAQGIRHYLDFGVTRVVASTISRPLADTVEQIKLLRRVREESDYGVMLHGVHLEGPWLAPRCRGGHPLEYLRVPDREEVTRVLEEVGDVIVTVTFAPELPDAVWLTETLARRGILPVIGHTEASYEEAEQVILAGARHVTHMYDGILGYRENPQEALVMLPGVETAVLMNDAVSIELIGCPVHVPRPFFKFIHKVKPRDKKVLVTDSLVGTGMPEGTVLFYRDGRKVRVTENVIRMVDEDPTRDGNLTGSAVTMNVALRRLKEYADLSIEEALTWGTINPARVLGIDREVGSIAVGKRADLVVIDEHFDVQYTVLDGMMAFCKS